MSCGCIVAPYGQDDLGELPSIFEVEQLRKNAVFLDTQCMCGADARGWTAELTGDCDRSDAGAYRQLYLAPCLRRPSEDESSSQIAERMQVRRCANGEGAEAGEQLGGPS